MALPKELPPGGPLALRLRLDTPAGQTVHFANDAMREGEGVRLR